MRRREPSRGSERSRRSATARSHTRPASGHPEAWSRALHTEGRPRSGHPPIARQVVDRDLATLPPQPNSAGQPQRSGAGQH
eukprot:15471395-Alexandrium_andersonii.AAC.1